MNLTSCILDPTLAVDLDLTDSELTGVMDFVLDCLFAIKFVCYMIQCRLEL